MVEEQLLYELPDPGTLQIQRDVPYSSVGSVALKMDIYSPGNVAAGQLLPAVIFIHGDGPEASLRDAKEWGVYQGWGRLITTLGCIGITFNHRSTNGFTTLEATAEDINAAIEHILAHAQEYAIDTQRIGIWLCSAGGPVAMSVMLHEPHPWLRCIVGYYPILELSQQLSPHLSDEALHTFSPLYLVQHSTHQLPPLLIVRAGQDHPALNASIDRFALASLAANAPLELINFPDGQHGFDIRTDVPQTRNIIRRTLAFFQEHLY